MEPPLIPNSANTHFKRNRRTYLLEVHAVHDVSSTYYIPANT